MPSRRGGAVKEPGAAPARQRSTRASQARRAPPIKVLIVDDQRTFAEALRIAVGLEKSFKVRVASGGEAAVEVARREHPHVVLMDIEMPGVDGIEATRRIKDELPDTRVVMLSAHEEDTLKAKAIEAGASGFLSKFDPMTGVTSAVRRTYRGEPLLNRIEQNRLLRRLRHQRYQDSTERQRANRLTPKQMEVLQLMADGVPREEIARKLNMSPLTLRTHVQNILTRLGVHTKLEALALVIRQGKVSARS